MTPVFETTFGRYRGTTQIGSGGSGTVWRAVDDDGNEYAIKYLSPTSVTLEKTKRFRNELAFCSRSQHKNILRVLDWGYVVFRETKSPFYVMPLYSSTLRDLIARKIAHNKVLPYFGQILDGVEAAHMLRVWHRDLKPENVLCDAVSDTLVVADFGVAHFAEEELLTLVETSPRARLANFQYAAPEQRAKEAIVDSRADIYALGLILNEMFTGLLAHGVGFKRISEVAPESAYLDDIVDMMLNQSPERRPQNIREIKALLIARGNDFISQQKIDALKKTVIPAAEPSDVLIADPPSMTNAHWENGSLYMTVSRPVNELWASCFKNPGSHTAIWGKGPESFEIRSNTLKIHSDGRDSQDLIAHTKNYIRMANENYKRRIEHELLKKRAEEESKLKQRIALEERTRAINARLKI